MRDLRIVSLLVLAALVADADAQSFSIKPLVLEGQPAPGGGTFASFESATPSVNNWGTVVFRGGINGGSATSGVFQLAGGSITPIVLQGQEAPGTGGGRFHVFSDPQINDAGDVAFVANIAGSPRQSGLFVFSRGTLSAAALEGFVPSANLFISMAGLYEFSLNDNGAVAFSAYTGNTWAIFSYSSGKVSVVALPSGGSLSKLLRRPSLNDAGEVVFVRYQNQPFGGSNPYAIDLYSKGSVAAVISPGMPAPGTGGGVLSGSLFGVGLNYPSVNNAGRIAFIGAVEKGTTSSGIFLYANGSLTPVALAGAALPGAAGGYFTIFRAPVLNQLGDVAFLAGSVPQGIFLHQGGQLIKVASGGDLAPGSSGGRFISFGNAQSYEPQIDSNDLGAIVFVGVVASGRFNSGIFLAEPPLEKHHFAHFVDGSDGNTAIFSEIILVNLDSTRAAHAEIEINDDTGNLLAVDLNGVASPGRAGVALPAAGSVTLQTDGRGPLRAGSVVVTSSGPLSGVVLFGGSIGMAGVGASKPLRRLVAPIESSSTVNTGVALMGLEADQNVQLELRDDQGRILAKSSAPLPARSHLARFISEFQWDRAVNFTAFSGVLTVTGTADFAATVLRLSPGEIATLPVASKDEEQR